MPWWLAGAAMVATTFAADTSLVVIATRAMIKILTISLGISP